MRFATYFDIPIEFLPKNEKQTKPFPSNAPVMRRCVTFHQSVRPGVKHWNLAGPFFRLESSGLKDCNGRVCRVLSLFLHTQLDADEKNILHSYRPHFRASAIGFVTFQTLIAHSAMKQFTTAWVQGGQPSFTPFNGYLLWYLLFSLFFFFLLSNFQWN